MTLGLRFKVNEGVNLRENLKRSTIKSYEIIFRGLNYSHKGISANFESRNPVGKIECFELFETESHDFLANCGLYVPRFTIGREGFPHYLKQSAFVFFFAPKSVQISRKRFYPLWK